MLDDCAFYALNFRVMKMRRWWETDRLSSYAAECSAALVAFENVI